MHDIASGEATPSVTRVSDAPETRFSFATEGSHAGRPGDLEGHGGLPHPPHLFDLDAMCLSFIGYEGSKRHVSRQRKLVGEIVKSHGGLCIGSGPGTLYDQKKFDTPYIRDYLLDRGALADVSETSAPWSALPTLYRNVMSAAQGAFAQLGVPGYIMCPTSRTPTTRARACTSPSP